MNDIERVTNSKQFTPRYKRGVVGNYEKERYF